MAAVSPGTPERRFAATASVGSWLTAMTFRRSGADPRASRMVPLFKVLLPLLAMFIVALILMWPQLSPDSRQFRLGTARVAPADAELLRMVSPRYVGVDEENRPFIVTADYAAQTAGDGDKIQLAAPKADVTLADGSWLALTAANGIYDRIKQTLALSGGVSVFHDAGHEFRTSAAEIDMAKGIAEGRQPVEGQGPFGLLSASGFRILDKGSRIQFNGKTRLELKASALARERPPPPAAKPSTKARS
jgi:lipopolysaccharide export system protein LptC